MRYLPIGQLSGKNNISRAAYLVAVTALGAWLRLRGLGVPSFWLDEILGYDLATKAAQQPLWRWLTIFDLEHGPLYYAMELAGRFLRNTEASARLFPALIGIATIPIAWFVARAIRSHAATPHIFTLLIAVSPLHIYYSREARPYALIVLAAMSLLGFFLREPRVGSVFAVLLAAFYTSAVTAPLVVSAAIVAAIRRWWTIAAASVVCTILIAACYRGEKHVSIGGISWPSLPWTAYVFAAFASFGAIVLFRRSREQALVAIGLCVLPAAIAVAAAQVTHHFFAIRYVISALPAFLLLVAVGVAAIPRLSIVIAVLLAAIGWNAALNGPFRKLDWRGIGQAIAAHAHENDPVIADSDASAIAIGFYMRGLSPHVRVLNARGTQMMGEVFAYQSTASWIVVAGESEFSRWACRFPIVLSSENFRLHYSPNAYYFLTDRSTQAEYRALLASFGGRPILRMGPGEDGFFGDGWGAAEKEGRRVIGTRALIAIPGAAGPLDLEIAPAGTPQSLTIYINDKYLQNIALNAGRHRYTLPAQWREGINIIRFELDRPGARVFAVGIGGVDAPDRSHPIHIEDSRFSAVDNSECGNRKP